MDRGTQALVASRARAQVSTGMQGSPYDDETHQIMVRNRDRVYTAQPPVDPAVRDEHENLFQRWFAFYTQPLPVERENDPMTAPERAQWYRQRSLEWQKWLDARDVQPTGPSSNWPAYLLGVTLTLGILGVVASRR